MTRALIGPTPQNPRRGGVIEHTAIGHMMQELAALTGVSEDTLSRRYADIIKNGQIIFPVRFRNHLNRLGAPPGGLRGHIWRPPLVVVSSRSEINHPS